MLYHKLRISPLFFASPVPQSIGLFYMQLPDEDLNARTYTEAQAADVVRMVLSAILHSHQKGIIHRDLKFENILWESDAPDAQIKVRG